mmetsp:Transcript_7118/g.14207  ORF Transcript_7118/g.14207 Transcript_7118/m.14207 type:complete len:311 (-) Transcript_7118:1078-2010(-)|eukprot:CAMPEP_0118804078 /NCGR_PEP_ID=MMETSP1161-20130426/20843_1 /TAXON_ID=249345 /ORGANISM="Picochlorum oklahomensis, Strain CCMP2329" /LENGTH=310 /DNA_ID=CAMNT_0006732739 /DNA_START=91 /DNA_END=1023 /DNA_ORIENTATION=-
MPLVVLSGNPSSGKSTVALCIQEECKKMGIVSDVVSEESLRLDRNSCYKDVIQEKMTLGVLRSEIARKLDKNTVVIFDSLNLIKGYRYEVWCLAKGASTRCCVVHVDTPVDVCREWNAARGEIGYREEIFNDLATRLERPDSKNRWEAPLFEVCPVLGEERMIDVCAEVASYSNPNRNQTKAMQEGDSNGTRTAAQPKVWDLTPGLATSKTELSSTNLLHDIDKELQAVVKHIIQAHSEAGGSAPGIIRFGPDVPTLHVTRPLTVPELGRYKRMFLKLVTNNTLHRKYANAGSIKPVFINYIKEQLHGEL